MHWLAWVRVTRAFRATQAMQVTCTSSAQSKEVVHQQGVGAVDYQVGIGSSALASAPPEMTRMTTSALATAAGAAVTAARLAAVSPAMFKAPAVPHELPPGVTKVAGPGPAPEVTVRREAFRRAVPLSAVVLRHPRLIEPWRKKLARAGVLLVEPRLSSIRPTPEPFRRCRGGGGSGRDSNRAGDAKSGLVQEENDKDKGVASDKGNASEASSQCAKLQTEANTPDSDINDVKCIVLNSALDQAPTEMWPEVVRLGVAERDILRVIPYTIDLDYKFWSWHDILEAALPTELQGEVPHGFNSAGHVAHLNLRNEQLPWRRLIAQVLLDKTAPTIRTVINKIDDVGEASAFRTFKYELLAGDDDLEVEMRESDCVFRFNYARTYWNSKLEPEHRRLVSLFRRGEVVADVMAGVGPFAVPAARKGCIVWANDFNPDSVRYMNNARTLNKVDPRLLRTFNMDGRKFVPLAVNEVLAAAETEMKIVIRSSRMKKIALPTTDTGAEPGAVTRSPSSPPTTTSRQTFPPMMRKKSIHKTIPIPWHISHFVMNLPATAIEFLGSFRGIYHYQRERFAATDVRLPLVHVYCFATKQSYAATYLSDPALPWREILPRVSAALGVPMKLGLRHPLPDLSLDSALISYPSLSTETVGEAAGVGEQADVSSHENEQELTEEAGQESADSQKNKKQHTTAATKMSRQKPPHDPFKSLEELGPNECVIFDVREVAPAKNMYCVSFRLPEEVAFAGTKGSGLE